MSRRITLHVQMKLLSDTILGAGFSIPGGEDIAVRRDPDGHPYLEGSTLKGLLRESLENWTVWTGGSEADVEELMGASGRDGLADDRRIQLSGFRVQDPPASPEECYGTRTFTSLTDAGTAESGTLRMASCVRRGTIFAGEVHCACEDEMLVKNALAAVKWVGTMRNRGFGRVQFLTERRAEPDAAARDLTGAVCIRYQIRTDSPVLVTDLARSRDNSYETRGYIPGSAIRGLIIGTLAKDDPDRFAGHRTELLSHQTRFLDALPVSGGRAALPAIKGFYENRDETEFETVMKSGALAPGLKRAKIGSFCAIEGDTLRYWSTLTGGATRILRGKGDAEKTMFQTRYIQKGQVFEGYIELDDPATAGMIAAALPETVWLGADRYGGFGKCSVLCCEAAESPPWRREYGCRTQDEVTRELYLLAVSPFTMLNTAGDPCGLSTEDLAGKLSVGRVSVAVCSTSMSEYGSYNRTWKSRDAAVRMYDRGSIFKLCCDRAPDIERLHKIEREGLGIRRAEGFGQVLFLRKKLFEAIRQKAAAEGTYAAQGENRAAAVRRARCRWVMDHANELRESGLSSAQLGTVQALCERAIACGGRLDELEVFFGKNLSGRGAKQASRSGKASELVKRVTTTPVGDTIGAPCGDSMTERLRLLCLLFDFSRKEEG